MLTPAPMKRVNLFILEKDEPAVTHALGHLKAIHLEPAVSAAPRSPLHEKPGRDKEAETTRQLLARIDRSLALLDAPVEGSTATIPYATPDEIGRSLGEIETRVDEIRRQLDRCQTDEQQLSGIVSDLDAFVGLGIPVDRLNDFSFLHFAVGSLPSASLGEVRESIGDNVILLPTRRGGEERLVAVTSKRGRFALETELEKAGFKSDKIDAAYSGLAEDLVTDAQKQLQRVDVQRELAENLRKATAETVGPQLRAWRRTLVNEARIIEAAANFAYTESACYITGWVPADQVNELNETVLRTTGGRAAVEMLDPDPDSEPPSKFRHSAIIRPFQMLVAGYGFPRYREIEPTLFVAISFLIMFGFMFGDIGHGGVLLVAGLLVNRLARKQKTRDMGFIVLACGVASVIFGFLFGSAFGFRVDRFRWVEPFENPIEVMTVAIIGGAVMISIGLIFNIINRLRMRDYMHGIFDKFGLVGAVMYWAILMLAFKALVMGSNDLPVATVLWIVGVGVVLLFVREPMVVFFRRRKGEHAESILEATILAIVEVMEVFISYLSNSVSFVRLAAYAISHGALLMATFEMVKLVQSMGSAGKPLGVLVFVLGNVVIIMLEGLVASIQAIRLEYYEFFGKFFSGTGRAYQPFEVE